MNKIKASPQYSMKVVPHRPWRNFLFYLLFAALLIAVAVLAFNAGQNAVRDESISVEQAVKLQNTEKESRLLISELKKQLAAAQLAAEVDRQALEELRQQFLVRREQVAEMEREVSLLRLMSSKLSSNDQGVGFGMFSVKPLDRRYDYQFRLVVHQLAETGDNFKGVLEAYLVGKQAGKAAQLPLHELVIGDAKTSINSAKIPVDFKYFQAFEASIRLPDDFEPEYLAAKLTSNARKSLVVEQQLEWLKVAAW